MTKPRLSICIATYNRADYIGETLESIIPQITDEVEIVVVDGASTDNTNDVVAHYMEVCRHIRYIRLPSKGGVDQDYCKSVEYAQGEMCWLFPDDDLLMPDAVGTVLKEVPNGYSLIVVNAQVMSKNISEVFDNNRLQINKNEIYDGSKLEKLFQRVIPYMSFIGCVVINRELWLHRETVPYFGTEFVHVGVIFQKPLPGPTLVIAEPHIMIRYGNAQHTPRAIEIWMFKWPNLLSSFKHISEQVRQEHQMTKPWRRLKSIILFRAKRAYTLKEYLKWFASKDSSLWWRLAALCIAVIPVYLINSVVLTYIKTLKKEALITIYELENT